MPPHHCVRGSCSLAPEPRTSTPKQHRRLPARLLPPPPIRRTSSAATQHMAHSHAAAAACFSPAATRRWLPSQVTNIVSSSSLVSFHSQRMGFGSVRSRTSLLRFKICCSAKKETVDKVCAIVKQQLALPGETAVTGESKFSELGADSLDTVEIVMGLEEEFNINVDETSAQDIATVQDAANLIEKLLMEKTA